LPQLPASLEPQSLIKLDHISKFYRGVATPAVDAVSLDVPAGALIAIVGTSGSGKTTVMKTINRLIDPDQGTVHVDGIAVGTLDAPTLRRKIGYVFQGGGLFPHMRVAENIGVTPRLLGWAPSDTAARTAQLLDLVELPQDVSQRFPSELSGGQQQRVAVARALAAQPKIVLMDEPFGALDPVTRDTLGTAYRAMHMALGLTTVMVTHDIQEAILLADRIVVMKAGRVIANVTPQELLKPQPNPDVAALIAVPLRHAQHIQNMISAGASVGVS
jgi:osmoprotectant transport system ATP-binding protein